MKRGISLIILLLCALCLQAQSDLTWIRTKEGRIVAVPKRAVFDLNLPKFAYKSFTPSKLSCVNSFPTFLSNPHMNRSARWI